ncbi:MAG: glycosyltransferase family 2 protein [Acidimicrobiia bacterium]
MSDDPRRRPPSWDPGPPSPARRRALAWRTPLAVAALVLYLTWLAQPARIGNPALYGLLVVAELFNVVHALGFWWTCARAGHRPHRPVTTRVAVDVLIPVYGEPVDIVEPTVAAARRLTGAEVRVAVLDDGGSPEIEAMARRQGARYVRRTVHRGAKAGNINHALTTTDAPFVAVFDCDHVPAAEFLERTLGHLEDPGVALVQTPQWYANADRNEVAAAAGAQQELFFGPISRGRDARGAMFCCGTNMVLRRSALEAAGGFPEDSVTEDFELSIRLHEAGWRTAYVAEVLSAGLGPEDMASYASQQYRWARGCLGAIPRILRARLPLGLRVQYLLSASYFLAGWTVLVYGSLPVVQILTGAQPVAGATADEFLLRFGPYFAMALAMVAVAGRGSYTFRAFALAAASWWIHVRATVAALRRTRGRFVVTPKRGSTGRQPRAVWPSLAAIGVLVVAIVVGLSRDRSPATLNNVTLAVTHLAILAAGVAPALRRRPVAAAATATTREVAAA